MGERKICRRCHQPVRPSEPAARFANGEVEHHRCFLGDQLETVSLPEDEGPPRGLAELLRSRQAPLPPASPSSEPDALLPLSPETIQTLLNCYGAMGGQPVSNAYEKLCEQALAAHDLQAASAELRAQRDKVEDAYLRVAKALGCAATAYEPLERIAIIVRENAALRARAEKTEAERDKAYAVVDVVNGNWHEAIRERDEARAERNEVVSVTRGWVDRTNRAEAKVFRLTDALAEMREACARKADTVGVAFAPWNGDDEPDTFDNGVGHARRTIAKACRALPLPANATSPTAAQEQVDG